jgi:hypothetical protein
LLAAACGGAVGAMPQQPVAAPPQASRPSALLSPSEVELYKGVQTLIDWTPAQIHDCPFLHKLRPARSQDSLPMVLDRVGQRCAVLLHDFPQVSCDEEVVSESNLRTPIPIVGTPPQPLKVRKFHYIVIPQPTGDLPGFQEYRTDLKGTPRDASSLSDLFMITSNFVSTSLYFSTAEQPDSTFRQFGIQMIRDHECYVVGFAQNPGRVHSIGVFFSPGKSATLLVQGLAWIDSESFQILRIMTWLLTPRTDINLSVETSTVDFFPVQPGGTERVLWLPRDVAVQAAYRGVAVRNTHHYTNFKLFRVESTVKP